MASRPLHPVFPPQTEAPPVLSAREKLYKEAKDKYTRCLARRTTTGRSCILMSCPAKRMRQCWKSGSDANAARETGVRATPAALASTLATRRRYVYAHPHDPGMWEALINKRNPAGSADELNIAALEEAIDDELAEAATADAEAAAEEAAAAGPPSAEADEHVGVDSGPSEFAYAQQRARADDMCGDV